MADEKLKSHWFELALIGALAYGSFSLIFSMVHKSIKRDMNAQIAYGSLVDVMTFPFVLVIFLLWSYRYPESYTILMDNMNCPLFMVFILFAVSTKPVHSIVINAGGSLGQQTMYSLAIVPVLIAGYFISSESLKSIQWLGILLAVIGTVLMNSKAH